MCALLACKNFQIASAALQYVGSVLVTETEEVFNLVLKQPNLMDSLLNLTKSADIPTIKQALWAMSNITASSLEAVRLFMSCPAAVARVVTLSSNPNPAIRGEALFVLCNAVTFGDIQVVKALAREENHAFLDSLKDGLERFQDPKLIPEILCCVQKIHFVEQESMENDEVGQDMSVLSHLNKIDFYSAVSNTRARYQEEDVNH